MPRKNILPTYLSHHHPYATTRIDERVVDRKGKIIHNESGGMFGRLFCRRDDPILNLKSQKRPRRIPFFRVTFTL